MKNIKYNMHGKVVTQYRDAIDIEIIWQAF